MQASSLAFYFDLSCPFSYLAAERVERMLGEVDWVPVAGQALGGAEQLRIAARRARLDKLRVAAERRAAELRLPLVWPDEFPAPVPGALRTAQCASDSGAGARFALAAARLAFCGGFDLEDPEVLAEAAAAAGMGLEDCLAAAGSTSRDVSLRATAHELAAQGVRELPAIRVGMRIFAGERRLPEAAALVAARAEPDVWRARQPVERGVFALSWGDPPARVS